MNSVQLNSLRKIILAKDRTLVVPLILIKVIYNEIEKALPCEVTRVGKKKKKKNLHTLSTRSV